MGQVCLRFKVGPARRDVLATGGIALGRINHFRRIRIDGLAEQTIGFSGAALVDQHQITFVVQPPQNGERLPRQFGGGLAGAACKQEYWIRLLVACDGR